MGRDLIPTATAKGTGAVSERPKVTDRFSHTLKIRIRRAKRKASICVGFPSSVISALWGAYLLPPQGTRIPVPKSGRARHRPPPLSPLSLLGRWIPGTYISASLWRSQNQNPTTNLIDLPLPTQTDDTGRHAGLTLLPFPTSTSVPPLTTPFPHYDPTASHPSTDSCSPVNHSPPTTRPSGTITMGVTKTTTQQGTGKTPVKGQKVTIEYTGWLKDTSKPNNKGDKFVNDLNFSPTPVFPHVAWRANSGQQVRLLRRPRRLCGQNRHRSGNPRYAIPCSTGRSKLANLLRLGRGGHPNERG